MSYILWRPCLYVQICEWLAMVAQSLERCSLIMQGSSGEWESLGNPCVSRSHMLRETTFYSQGTHVLPLPGQPGRYVFMADRWLPQALGMSR